jgi:hypothetical protein
LSGSPDRDAYVARQYRLCQIARDLLLAFSDDELRADGQDPDQLRRTAAKLDPGERAKTLTDEERDWYRSRLTGQAGQQ